MGVAGSDLSQRNRGKPLTLEFAQRIVKAVDDQTFTIADLGAPSSTVAEADPTVLDRLEDLAAAVGALSLKVDLGLETLHKRLKALEKPTARPVAPTPATSTRKRKTA
jgi:hypothetical protein